MATFSTLQVLHVIRHGESEYNAATSYGMDFSDPQIFNPKLTEKGRKQVCVIWLLYLYCTCRGQRTCA